ncbi:hypothetical protein SNOG_13408 [Parastagonospora nodorum SN15]|uniref:Uncharacterized protein n=1 Tax=Phaeosphaeria nodorum (strain SN15 / ATCC MYA-4574 / FGSC 10173) TaxID=321614 RepID=Q0U4A6_PHANO|nr:hypothetical protein SNOG_13408 [Parastagonospora nodorum SN15]EAT79292.1 hypothetical protein SNOG_13408 [Parastagonospora nodorum SN15]
MASSRGSYWLLDDRYKATAPTSRPTPLPEATYNYESPYCKTLKTLAKQEVDSQPRSAPASVDPLPPEPRARSVHQQAYERLDAKKRKINEEKRQIMEEQRRIRIWAGKRRDQLKTARELVRRAEAEKQIALANARSYTGIRAIRPGR